MSGTELLEHAYRLSRQRNSWMTYELFAAVIQLPLLYETLPEALDAIEQAAIGILSEPIPVV